MSSSRVDRNLLFGFLALQNGFIGREEMVAAVSAWLLDKARPLDGILRERGALADDEYELIAALARKHLDRHGNDPEQSLAALSSLGSVHDELKQLGDAELEASLSHAGIARLIAEPQFAETLSFDLSKSGVSRFRILRPHAKGGLGEVYVARDTELNREVALKEIRAHLANDSDSRARFLLEAEITGGLEHPGIVPVYGLGQYADGRPFYAMRFIRGDSLKEAIDRFVSNAEFKVRDAESQQDNGTGLHSAFRIPRSAFESVEFRKLLGRFIDVCNAIEYAHSRGVLHRDLKPGNIMLGKYGETLVVDWGLAKITGRDDKDAMSDEQSLHPKHGSGSVPTLQGKAIGTPGYMSPEQASGRLDLLGSASDVYSLGATLYAVLTGQAPFHGDDKGEILRKVPAGDFPRPREVSSHVPKALEAICLKAMALRPADRYRSPQALADDVEAFLADEPMAAVSESLYSRGSRWLRRNRGIAATAAAALVAIATSGFVSMLIINDKQIQVAKLQHDAQLGEVKEKQLHIATAYRLAAESSAVRNDYSVRSLLLAIEGVRATTNHGEPVVPEAETQVWASLNQLKSRPLAGHDETAGLELSPDGKTLATLGADGKLLIRKLVRDDTPPVELTSHDRPLKSIRFSPKGNRLVTVDEDANVGLWDLSVANPAATCQRIRLDELLDLSSDERGKLAEHGLSLHGFTSNGRWLLAEIIEGGWFAYDFESRGTVRIPSGESDFQGLALSPDEQCVVFRSGGKLRRRKLETLADGGDEDILFSLPRGSEALHLAALSDRWMAVQVVTNDQWETATVDLMSGETASVPSERFSRCRITSNDRWLVVTDDIVSRAWRLPIKQSAAESPSIDLRGQVLAMCSNNRWALVHQGNDTYRLWDLAADDPVKAAKYFPELPTSLRVADNNDSWGRLRHGTLTPDGAHLVGLMDGTPRIWNLADPLFEPEVRVLRDEKKSHRGIRFSPDGNWLAAGSVVYLVDESGGEETLSLWSLTNKNAPSKTLNHGGRIRHFVFSPNNAWLATCGDDGVARLWSLNDEEVGDQIGVLRGHEGPVTFIAVPPDGKAIITAGMDQTVRIWDVANVRSQSTPIVLQGAEAPVKRLALSNDGRWLAAGTENGWALLWDLRSPSSVPPKKMHLHRGAIHALVVAPNGRWVVSGSSPGDNKIQLWNAGADNLASSRTILAQDKTFPVNRGPLLSEDGKWVVASKDQTIYVWRANFDRGDGDPLESSPREFQLEGNELGLGLTGNRLVTFDFNAIYIWDLASDDPMQSRRAVPQRYSLGNPVLSADGRWLAAQSFLDQQIRLRSLDTSSLLQSAAAVAGRRFTDKERKQYFLPQRIQ